MSNLSADIYVSDKDCDGLTAATAMWERLPVETRAHLAKYGGRYAKDEKTKASEVHTPEMAMKILKEWPENVPQKAVFVSVYPKTMLPAELIAGNIVFVMDLDLGEASFTDIYARAFKLFVFDHHPGTAEALKGIVEVRAGKAMSKDFKLTVHWNPAKTESAASLTWKVINPIRGKTVGQIDDKEKEKIPLLVEMVQIQDTWSWQQRPDLDVKAYMEAAYTNGAFATFDSIAALAKDARYDEYVKDGRLLLKYKAAAMKSITDKAAVGYIYAKSRSYKVRYVESMMWRSEIGDALRTEDKSIDFTCVWSFYPAVEKDGKVKPGYYAISMRGAAPGMNLGQIAKDLELNRLVTTGGGHNTAAAVTIPAAVGHINDFITPVPTLSSKMYDLIPKQSKVEPAPKESLVMNTLFSAVAVAAGAAVIYGAMRFLNLAK